MIPTDLQRVEAYKEGVEAHHNYNADPQPFEVPYMGGTLLWLDWFDGWLSTIHVERFHAVNRIIKEMNHD